jgi:hypothetical protein
MVELRQYNCWEPEVAATTINTEAVSPSRAVFFATHAPLRIHRRSAQGAFASAGTGAVDEETVRRDFLTRPTANGVLFMPVIGQSGTGKSHLVRWINEKTPPTDSRHVIYLPKAETSLKSVVQRLLDGCDGESLAQLRDEVARASVEVDSAGLQQRLLNQMQEALAAAEPSTATARVLTGPKGLAVLLLDPHVREHLLLPGRLIPRRAAHLLAEKAGPDPDLPLTFTPSDLPLDIADVRKASEMARKLLSLIQSRVQLQTAAVEMLNAHLDVAVMNAMNVGVGRLQNAMLQIRREFAREGKEIVLLIEDFALIQGVQRDLLDAVIEPGVRDGRTVLAPVRTLMAVTTGYYQRLVDTVLTRARAATPYVYDLDVQFVEGEAGVTEVTSFVGRYLNAARLGSEALERAAAGSTTQAPNACTDCPLRADCHAAFGASAQGFGLYPFNRPSLLRSIHARASAEKPLAFNPRTIVGEVVRNVLVEHALALRAGTFPDSAFRNQYPTADIDEPLNSSARRAVEDADPTGADRRSVFLEFWGDAPTDLTNLDPILHRAFSLPLLDLGSEVEPRRAPISPSSSTTRQPQDVDGLSASVRQEINNVEEWYTRGKPLINKTALNIRSMICDAVVNRCQWNDPLMAEPTAEVMRKAWPSKSVVVSIEGAEAENLQRTQNAPIKFARTSANSQFFQGLLRAKAGQLPGSAEHVRRLADLAERHQGDLVRRIQAEMKTTDEYLTLAMRASLLGAGLAGRAWPGMQDSELMAAALDEGRDWSRDDSDLRTAPWRQTWERHRAVRAELVSTLRDGMGISRGVRGGVRTVDAARALPLLRAAAQGWAWPTPTTEPPAWIRKAVAGFADWDALVDAQLDVLRGRLGQIRALLPKGTRGSETVPAVAQALDAALRVGLGSRGHGEQLQQILPGATTLDWTVVDRLERDLDRSDANQPEPKRRAARMVAAIRQRGSDLDGIHAFLVTSDTWLTQTLDEARMRQNSVGDTARDQVQQMLMQWAELGTKGSP